MNKRIGCMIYFAGGDPITVTNSEEEVRAGIDAGSKFTVTVSTGHGYSLGTIYSAHVVAIVDN